MKTSARRGMTLAEVTVSLALVSVMIVMAVSFVTLVAKRTGTNAANEAVRRDCLKVESGIENWMNAVCGEDISAEQGVLNAGEYKFGFLDGAFTATLPEGENINLYTESVRSAEFEVMKNGADFLVFCRIECENSESGRSVFHTFCINPRIGENGGA